MSACQRRASVGPVIVTRQDYGPVGKRTALVLGVQEIQDAVRHELFRVALDAELVQLPQHRLTLVVLAQVLLQASARWMPGGCVTRSATAHSGSDRGARSAAEGVCAVICERCPEGQGTYRVERNPRVHLVNLDRELVLDALHLHVSLPAGRSTLGHSQRESDMQD